MNIISILEASITILALLLAADYFDSLDKKRTSFIEKIWKRKRS